MTFKSFSQIRGQERAIRFLKQVIAGGKIPHAYLFTGIPGVGKTTTALALAQALNCREPINEEGCGGCRACKQVMNGNFPDLISIEPDNQNIKIDQIRELNRNLCFKPVTGPYRVSIIHQAETMTAEAANAFLKTLEEPPPGNILILKVTEPLDLLGTIISRCQKIPFRPLTRVVIKELLMTETDIDEESALLLANISEGSLGQAIDSWEGDFLQKREEAIVGLIQLPSIPAEDALDMALMLTREAKKAKTDEKGKDLFNLFGLWKSWLRDLIVVKVGWTEALFNLDFSRNINKTAHHLGLENLINGFFLLDQAQKDLRGARNLDLMMENLVLNLRKCLI
ncbi:MAG: DNA polymerase III subunit delta' [Deltaproteobacteria bacterium]|nr:DNA polymerase III subunit delta' [Deltaproteobacteria bacterium]